MTFDAALEKATTLIDAQVVRLLDESFARFVSRGIPIAEAEQMLAGERDIVTAWRDEFVEMKLPIFIQQASDAFNDEQ